MKISYNWLKEFVGGKLPKPEKVAELLTMHAFEVDGIEKAKGDIILDVAVLPNRAHDCLSHVGIAKEVNAILKRNMRKSKPLILKEDKSLKIRDYLSVKVDEQNLCPQYTSRVILDVKVSRSPQWLKKRLEALGQRSVNNIVDATNLVMLELGQPFHAFDLDKIEGKKIIVRKAYNSETVKLLGEEKHVLRSKDLVIADKKGVLAIAGVKGGEKAEVSERTKNIVLESAYFNPVTVRRTSKRIGVRTDASIRFENGVVPTLPSIALDQVASLIIRLARGKAVSGVINTAKKGIVQKQIAFTPERVISLLGKHVPTKEIISILERLGFTIKKSARRYIATIPHERLDIESDADIAEEVGRLYGFMNIPSVLPQSVLIPGEQNDDVVLEEKIKTALVHSGFGDTYNRSFIGDAHVKLFGYNQKRLVSVANPLSEDQKYLRPSLLFHLLDNCFSNLKHQKNVRLFEVGNVFTMWKDDAVHEKKMVAGLLSSSTQGARREGQLFYELKGVSDVLLSQLGLTDVWYDDVKATSDHSPQTVWHNTRVAGVKVGNTEIGTIGEVNPRVLHAIGIQNRVAAFQFSLSKLLKLTKEEREYKPINKYPAVERDIAVLVPSGVKVDSVQYIIETAGGELLFDSDLFDIYEGEHLEAEQKSLAFHLIFQSPSRTLTDKEVDALFNRISRALSEEGWEVRK